MPNGKPRDGIPANRLGSKARCDALLVEMWMILRKDDHSLTTDFKFVLTAGYTKESPGKPTEKVPQSLAAQIEQYIRSQNFHPGFIFVRDKAWGTLEETLGAISLISDIAAVNWTTHPQIYVSTNLGHMPRVWLCWFFLKPKGWKVHFVLAKHSFTPKEWVQETVKFFVYLYRFVFKKW